MKIIYIKRISKDGNTRGKTIIKKIKSCKDCHWSYEGKCDFTKNYLNKDDTIPDWCPLENYEEDTTK